MAEPCSEGWIHTEAGNIGNASVSYHLLPSREFRSQISIIKLSPGILSHHPSSHHNTVCGIRSPQRIICGYIFWRFTFLPFRCHQCRPLFLIIRPGLLLFPRPEGPAEPEIELAQTPQDTASAIFSDTTKFQHSPDPTSTTLGDECSKESAAPSHVQSRLSRPLSDDVEI